MLVVESMKKKVINEELNCEYFYKLTKSSFEGNNFYGVEIERQDFKEEKLINIERENINYVEINKSKALELLNTLWANEVSPIHLIDIVGEYSDQIIENYGMKMAAFCN